MARTVKHFTLHRIDATELRVIAEVEVGVLGMVEAEEQVIRGYIEQGMWPHRCVTLFIMENLEPLVRQLRSVADLPPGGAEALAQRAVVNVYDLTNPQACQIFADQQTLLREGYWDDPLSVRALLAHEHAHPLAEGPTTRESRRMELKLSFVGLEPILPGGHEAGSRRNDIRKVIVGLADKLCVDGPREVLANEVAIRAGFGDALLHLNRRNVANARSSLTGRGDVREHLRQQVDQGSLTQAGADLLLVIGDLQAYLDLSIETAAFYRATRKSDARKLETVLETEVFPNLEPEVAPTYVALREHYLALRPDMSESEVAAWGEATLKILADALGKKGLKMRYHVRMPRT